MDINPSALRACMWHVLSNGWKVEGIFSRGFAEKGKTERDDLKIYS